MSLSDIKDKLYKKDFDSRLSQHEESEFDARNADSTAGAAGQSGADMWAAKKGSLNQRQKRVIHWGVIAVVGMIFVALAVVTAVKFKESAFNDSRVIVEIQGPQQAESSKLLTYDIVFKNNNRAALKNAVLRVTYPESFRPEQSPNFRPEGENAGSFELGEIAGGADGHAALSGKLYSPRGSLITLKADLSYTPSSVNSTFSAKSQIEISIISSPIVLEIMAPQYLASGDSLDYLITYKNEGQREFDNLKVQVEYPEGFSFSSAVPKSAEGNNVWYVGKLSPGQGGKIVISGKMEGTRNDVRSVRVYIGTYIQDKFIAYSEEKTETKIAASPLSISQTVNGKSELVVNAGEILNFQIKFRNNSEIGYRDAIVTEVLDSPVLDYTSLKTQGGSFNVASRTLTWKAVDYPSLRNLNPAQEGTISFNIKVKDVIPIENENDRNFIISSIAKIDSPDIPTPIQMNKIIAGNKMDMKLNSKLMLDVKGYYYNSAIANSGPLPPVVGQETTYTINWKASNVSNDVSGAKVEASLPTGVVMTGEISPEGAHLKYNERTNTLLWEIGNMKAGKGILNSPEEISFQVKLKPGPNQINSPADLLKQATFTAKDEFTREELRIYAEGKTTQLREDSGLSNEEYRVVSAP